jgi:ribosome biogenesis GTPase
MPRRRLTERQRRRIRSAQAERRTRAGTAPDRETAGALGPEEPGLVLVHHGGEVLLEDANASTLRATPRQHLGDLVAGDTVVIQRLAIDPQTAVIVARGPRDSVLERKDASGRSRAIAANIDQIIVLIAVEPAPQRYLIDRYLAAASSIPAEPILVLNKIDLPGSADEEPYRDLLDSYRQAGLSTAAISATRGDGLQALKARLRTHTSLIVGQSGVGKSSLVKALLPEAQIRIGELSEAVGEGRHTTRTSRLYHLPQGGHLIDSPGVRGFDPAPGSAVPLDRGFREFLPHLGHCRFSDCRHTVEPGCAVRQAVERGEIDPRRYESYLRMRRESGADRA